MTFYFEDNIPFENAPKPPCENCITLAMCKSYLSKATNYTEAMTCIEELSLKCSLLCNYVMKELTYKNQRVKSESTVFKYRTIEENRAVTAFKQILPDNKVKVLNK